MHSHINVHMSIFQKMSIMYYTYKKVCLQKELLRDAQGGQVVASRGGE